MGNQQSKEQPILIPYMRELLQLAEQGASYSLLAGHNIDAYLRKLAELAEVVIWTKAEKVKGFIAFYCNDPAKDSAFITMVVVDPRCRGQGIGYALVDLVLNTARVRSFRACRLRVHQDNIAAIKLYEGHGFAVIEDNTEYRLMELVL